MSKRLTSKMRYAVDLPSPEGEVWIAMEYFETKGEAIKYAREKFGADKEGKVKLVSAL